MKRLALALLLASFAASPAIAKRDLPVAAGAAWRHAKTGIELPVTLGGLQRRAVEDLGDGELDVMLQYGGENAPTQATLYVFRPGGGSLPLWFDRAETQIRLRPAYGTATPVTPRPIAFARPGSTTLDSLRRVYAVSGTYKWTGVAAVPVGGWLVVARLSSSERDAAALDAMLASIVAGVRLPATAPAAPPAKPVEPCATRVVPVRAKLQKVDRAQTLLAGVTRSIVDKPDGTRAPFCRDGGGNAEWGMYRIDDGNPAYYLALGDAGRLVEVSTGLSAFGGKRRYGVTLFDLDRTLAYPSFDKLPLPDQALELLDGTPLSMITDDGESE